jgi:hypothetical protein
MKDVTIMIDDEFYAHLERYSFEYGEDISTTIVRCCALGLTTLISQAEGSSYTIEDWKRERSFGKYGRRKNLSHTLR